MYCFARPSSLYVNGRHIVIDTSDTFGGEKYTRTEILNINGVDNVVVGSSAVGNSIQSNPSRSGGSSSSFSGTLDGINNATSNNSQLGAILPNVSGATSVMNMRSTPTISSATNQLVTITYVNQPGALPKFLYLRSNQAGQLQLMLRYLIFAKLYLNL
jgi:hypothetical protein